jgi:hypothetical protein
MLNRHNLSIAALASRSDNCYSLGSILVEPKRTAVTDGHLALTVSTPDIPDADAPAIEGFSPTLEFAPFMLPAAAALDIAKAIPKNSNLPVLQNAFVDAGANGTANLAVTDLETPRIFGVKKTEGKFPNVDMVIPKTDDAEIAIALSPDLLIKLLRVMSPICDSKQPSVILRIKDPESQIRIDAKNPVTGQEAIGVLMPMQAEGTHGVRSRTARAAEQEAAETPARGKNKKERARANRKESDPQAIAEMPAPEPAAQPEPEDRDKRLAKMREYWAKRRAAEKGKAEPAPAPQVVAKPEPAPEPAPRAQVVQHPSAKAPKAPKTIKTPPPATVVATPPPAIAPASPIPHKAVPAPNYRGRGGYQPTPEALAKMRAASLAYWAARKAARS